MLGLIVLVAAGLLLLALATYTPSDPSFNTVGGTAGLRPAHNWTGLLGAYTADALLQVLGLAVIFVPLMLVRIGISWMRSQAVGRPLPKLAGLALWLLFAPAAIALLPGHLLWRHSLPVEGVSGRILADTLIHLLNFPGAAILCVLAVTLSLYLATTFALSSARAWFFSHFAFVRALRERHSTWRERRRDRAAGEVIDAYETRRDSAIAKARAEAEAAGVTVAAPAESPSLVSSFFGWFSRRKSLAEDDLHVVAKPSWSSEDADPAAEPRTLWQTTPRIVVDPVDLALHHAAPVAAATAAALAADASLFPTASAEDNWLDSPDRNADTFAMPEPAPARMAAPAPRRVAEVPPLPPMPSPMQPIADQNISFGKRADADVRPVAMSAKSIRGYKLPPSSLLYRSDEQVETREEQLLEDAKVLVEKCGEFGVDGNVTQINPGPVVTTFEFKPDSGVKYSRVTGLADDLCLAMAAESILIERMPGKSTVGIQVPNHERETIWLRDVVECESFAQIQIQSSPSRSAKTSTAASSPPTSPPCRTSSSPAPPAPANPSPSTR